MAKRKSRTEFTQADDDLLAELGVEHESAPVSSNALQERVLAGFEDIQRFVQVHQRLPKNQEGADIFERLYAVRLERLRTQSAFHDLLSATDQGGLLSDSAKSSATELDTLSDEELLEALGVEQDTSPLSELRHVRSQAEIKATPEDIAKQQPCTDFKRFAPLFENAQAQLKSGVRQARQFGVDASIREGDFFVLAGQLVYVAGIGEYFKAPNGEQDARLRAIYSNGTESNLLLRSLQRALYKDEASRRLVEVGPDLFADSMEPDDIENGFIYVLRSLSEQAFVAQHRELIHKIGVTGRSIESRIANAEMQSTFLFAPVAVVASYKLAGLNRTKLENLIHRVFASAQLDVVLHDPYGAPMRPREWFLVPIHMVDAAVQGILDGKITQQSYDPLSAQFVDLVGN